MHGGTREAFAAGRLAVGTRLGKYQILRFIAEGGMGELYVARASGIEGFEKTVALKRILSRFAGREGHVKMFLDEARLAATLHHPNIVQVFDIGQERGVLFFSMEYVHGTDVRAILGAARDAAKPLPLEAALEIACGCAAGLHHAHQAGVIHRDVSPSNVLVAHDGVVKLTDFGVAKMEEAVDTHSGVLKGKVAYMSPEQCRGDALDRRSDVFALGILLYELTTLDQPFSGSSDFAIMERVVHHDAAPPHDKHPEYPTELEALVMRALSRDREKRPATAQELLRELRAFIRDRRLDVSPLALEGYMRELFGDRVDAWREAEVQSSLPAPTAVTVREGPAADKPPPEPVARPRARWPIVAIGGVAIAGASFAWLRTRGDGDPVPETSAVTPPPTPVRADPPRDVVAPIVVVPRRDSVPPPPESVTPKVTKPAPRRVAPPPLAPRDPGVSVGSNPPPPPPAPEGSAKPRQIPWDPDSPTFPKK